MSVLQQKQYLRSGVIQAHIQGQTVKQILDENPGLSRATVYRWIYQYEHGGRVQFKAMGPQAKKIEYQSKILEMVAAGISCAEIHRRQPQVSVRTIYRWIIDNDNNCRGLMMKNAEKPQANRELKEENLSVMGLKRAKVSHEGMSVQTRKREARIDLLETLISLAEERFGISIRKQLWAQAVRQLHEKNGKGYTIKLLCEVIGYSKQAYYKHTDTGRALRKDCQERMALDYARQIREKDPGIGLVKLWKMYSGAYKGEAIMGRDQFVQILVNKGFALRKKSRKPRTTDSRHGLPLYPNLIRDLIVTRPNQVWVSDITYLDRGEDSEEGRFCYLALITDMYTHEIVGWDVSRSLGKQGAIRALEKALKGRGEFNQGLIHHSDRGVQYASSEYVKRLRAKGICVSMTEKGDPKENAVAERANGIIKNELLKGKELSSFEQVVNKVEQAVNFYNRERPHMSCGMHTPQEAALMSGRLPKTWVSYRERAIDRQLRETVEAAMAGNRAQGQIAERTVARAMQQ